MGQTNKPNLALPTEPILNLLNEVSRDIQASDYVKDKLDLVIFVYFVAFLHVLSLRGWKASY